LILKQLALAVSLPAHAVFDTFISNGNENLIVQLQALSRFPNCGETVFISGAKDSGKTHLLHALCHACPDDFQPTYLNLANPDFSSEVLEGWNNSQLICLDNIDAIQARADWEEALFDLFNRRLERDMYSQASLVMAASVALSELDIQLPDLRSRLTSGLMFQLNLLDEMHLPLALHAHAQQRGLEIPGETLDYLLKRIPRELSVLMRWLDETDKASLVAQRRLTIPFVKSLLGL
jgi:DnaA family protein